TPANQAFGLLFSLDTGVRLGKDGIATPLVRGGVSIVHRRWEYGTTAVWEASHCGFRSCSPAPAESPSNPNPIDLRPSHAVAVGLSVGPRGSIGHVMIRGGGRLSFAVVSPRNGGSQPQGRIGAYVGMAFLRDAGLRFRADFGPDFVVASKENGIG